MLFTFLILMLLFSFLITVIITSAFLGFLFTRVPFVPTYKDDVEFFVKKLSMGRKDVFYDLGSGDGKVVFLVEKFSNARTIGFELTWWTHVWAIMKAKFSKSKAVFKNQNFFKHSWNEATVVYGYLYPPLMRRVEEKFLQDCKPGTFAVIRDFPFPNLKPLEIISRPKKHELYLYLK